MIHSFKECHFDSQFFDLKVNEVELSEDFLFDSNAEKEIYQQALQLNLNLVVVRSKKKATSCQLSKYVGSLESWAAPITLVLTKLNNAPKKYLSRPVEQKDWPAIHQLLQFSSITRFSMDQNFNIEKVRIHKMNLLQLYLNKSPTNGIVVLNSNGDIVGFHFGFLQNDTWNLYELLVHPKFRSGFTAIQLVKDLLRMQNDSIIKNLQTSIYDHNNESKNFFTKLGFLKTNQVNHFYHLWIPPHQK